MDPFQIGDVTYSALPIPGRAAVRLWRRFAALAGPSLGGAVAAAMTAEGDVKDGAVFASLRTMFEGDDAETLVLDLCAYAMRGGMALGKDDGNGGRMLDGVVFDVAFTGRPLEAAEVALRVAESAGFFSHRGVSLRTLLVQQWAKVQAKAAAAP